MNLSCRNLHAGYEGVPALAEVSLELASGELLGVLGPNGSGKTTLLHALAGILVPTAGSVLLDGRDAALLTARERARVVACLFQRAAPPPAITVRELALLERYPWLAPFSRPGPRDEAAVRQALLEADALNLADRLLPALSGGEFQRARLAALLARQAACLLLDEPAAGLDPARALELFTFLRRRAKKGCAGILAVMHEPNLAALFCDRLVFLKNGRVVADGPVKSVFTREVLETVYAMEVLLIPHPNCGVPQMLFQPKK